MMLLDELVDDRIDHEDADEVGAVDFGQPHKEITMPRGGEGAQVQEAAATQDL